MFSATFLITILGTALLISSNDSFLNFSLFTILISFLKQQTLKSVMNSYSVRLIDRTNEKDPGELFNFKLPPTSTILDLRSALNKVGGFENPERLRILYRLESNQLTGVEDDELLDEITERRGEFIAELEDLGPVKVTIEVASDLVAHVAILNGSAKNFEHYLLTRTDCNIRLPNGKCLLFF